MVDNVTLNAGTGGETIKTDDDGTAHWQYVKLAYGADNTQTRVTTAAPLPVDLRTDNLAGNLDVNIAAQTADITIADGGNSITVDGTVTANAGTGTFTVDLGANNDVTIDGSSVVFVDDTAIHTAATTQVVGIGAVATPTDITVDANDIAMPAMSTDRRLHTDTQIVGQDANLTVDLGATDNAVLDQIEVNTSYGDNTGNGTAAGSLRVTIASDSTGVLSVDDNGGSLTVDGTVTADAGTGNFNNASIFADDAAFTLTTSSVTVGGAIRDDALSTLTAVEGDAVPLRVSSTGALHVTGGGGGTEYTEDDAAAANPIGNAQILVRQDTPATLTSADGDNVARRATNYGAAYTQILDSSGNFIDTFGGSGGTAATDDGAFTAGVGQGTPMMGFVSADVVDSGDVGVVAMSTDRRLHVDSQIVGQDADITIADGGNSITVDGGVTIDGSSVVFTDDTSIHTAATTQVVGMGAVAAPTDATVDANDIAMPAMSTDRRLHTDAQIVGQDANLTVDLGATDNAVLDQIEVNTSYGDNTGNGTAAGSLRVTMASDSTGQIQLAAGSASIGTLGANSGVDIGDVDVLSVTPGTSATSLGKAEDAVHATGDVGVMALTRRIDTAASSAGTSGDYATLNTDASGRLYTAANAQGTVAHDAVNSGNPLLCGARASNNIEGLTQVANGDRTHLQADLNGCLVTRNATTLEELLTERVSDTAGTSTNFTTFGAGGAGVHNYITSISVTNTNASTDGYVDFRDGSAGSVIWSMPAPATGGSVLSFDPPLKFAANTAVAYDVSAAITSVIICISGFQAQG